MEAVKTVTYKKHRIEIHLDEEPMNPREEWDNLATMICAKSNRFVSGDKDVDDPVEALKEAEKDEGEIISLPLYVYEHSGFTIRTTPFNDRWDSGPFGFIYVSVAKAKKEMQWKVMTKKREAKIRDLLRSEVETYDQYLTGEVYGYKVFDETGEELDSCWGFFGECSKEDSYIIQEAKAVVDAELRKIGEQMTLPLTAQLSLAL